MNVEVEFLHFKRKGQTQLEKIFSIYFVQYLYYVGNSILEQHH